TTGLTKRMTDHLTATLWPPGRGRRDQMRITCLPLHPWIWGATCSASERRGAETGGPIQKSYCAKTRLLTATATATATAKLTGLTRFTPQVRLCPPRQTIVLIQVRQ